MPDLDVGKYRRAVIRAVGCTACGAEKRQSCRSIKGGLRVVDYVHDDRSAAHLEHVMGLVARAH